MSSQQTTRSGRIIKDPYVKDVEFRLNQLLQNLGQKPSELTQLLLKRAIDEPKFFKQNIGVEDKCDCCRLKRIISHAVVVNGDAFYIGSKCFSRVKHLSQIAYLTKNKTTFSNKEKNQITKLFVEAEFANDATEWE